MAAKQHVIQWLHEKAEPGVPFHYSEVCKDTGYGSSAVSKALYDLAHDSKMPVAKDRTKGMWTFGPFADSGKPPFGNIGHVPNSTITRTRQLAATPEVLGFTPQGNMVTRDADGTIRIWIPAEHPDRSGYRYGE